MSLSKIFTLCRRVLLPAALLAILAIAASAQTPAGLKNTGVSGHVCPMFIPPFIQFQGTATIVVTVEGLGVGAATVNVTP